MYLVQPTYRSEVTYWVKGSVRVLFWNLHSRGKRGRKGRECKFQNKSHGTFDPRNTSCPVLISSHLWWSPCGLIQFTPTFASLLHKRTPLSLSLSHTIPVLHITTMSNTFQWKSNQVQTKCYWFLLNLPLILHGFIHHHVVSDFATEVVWIRRISLPLFFNGSSLRTIFLIKRETDYVPRTDN